MVRRSFGAMRRLPSGRWQASYIAPDGLRRRAPSTFATKTDADRWLVTMQADIVDNRWRDPREGRQLFDAYAVSWIGERAGLRPRTVDLYRWLHSKYLRPHFGQAALIDINPSGVRRWRTQLLDRGVSPSMSAKAYRLLRAILNTAVSDGTLAENPCRIRGAGDEKPAERPVLQIEQVLALAEQVPARFSAMILTTTLASLRWGEVTALRRADIDLATGVVVVHAAFVERSNGSIELGPPKSRAGRRLVVLPNFVVQRLAAHLDAYTHDGSDALVFTGPSGRPLRRSNFNTTSGWRRAAVAIGVPHLHFHDLRHTGNTLAAGTPGTSTRDLMERMGHDSMRAALIYQHATRNADRRIAAALDRHIEDHAAHDVARMLHGANVIDLQGRRRDVSAPEISGLLPGAGDGNRTRTVSLGS